MKTISRDERLQIDRLKQAIKLKEIEIMNVKEELRDKDHKSKPQLSVLRVRKKKLNEELEELNFQFDKINPENKL